MNFSRTLEIPENLTILENKINRQLGRYYFFRYGLEHQMLPTDFLFFICKAPTISCESNILTVSFPFFLGVHFLYQPDLGLETVKFVHIILWRFHTVIR